MGCQVVFPFHEMRDLQFLPVPSGDEIKTLYSFPLKMRETNSRRATCLQECSFTRYFTYGD